MIKLTTKEVIKQFRNIHGDVYNYDFVNYVNAHSKIKIVCRKHGIFEQTSNQHKKGSGCTDCAIDMRADLRRLDTDTIISQFKEVHGDLYDYSLVDYKSSVSKVKIICKEHGVFEQTPSDHKSGRGCGECVGKYKTTEKLITQFKEVHGDLYDYRLVDYTGAKNKVKILCREHGLFEQLPYEHKKGSGCIECVGLKKFTTEEIINQFKEVHSNLYDYSLVDYKNKDTKIKIICKEHGVFEQVPNSHKKGYGCVACAGFAKLNTEEIISQFKEVHGDLYDYRLVDYTGIDDKVKIICKEHGIFEQKPYSHKIGQGCKHCRTTSDYDAVYLWRANSYGRNTYKIGLTSWRLNRSRVESVAQKHDTEYELLALVRVEDALSIEKELHSIYDVTPDNIDKAIDGYTEFRILTDTEVYEILDYLGQESLEASCELDYSTLFVDVA